ncbi:alpha/beta fold hydrolase [Candidatus Oscillochloris fontis]|uniref:alpha/beta fold hydrolase n=1 Tax=Candidatus Oscillochloris fontis TaxID=2496868 RepID=UPI001930FBF6|nr:alpha/beta fold hydrolase [Candidatus Oscillochloris fontis]
MPHTTINGITLHYADEGDGSPILFLHAFPLSGAMWQPQRAALADQFRLIVPDLRGFGATDVPPGLTTMEQCADDMAALLDHLGLAQVAVCGLSMGGYIAMAMLQRHPARISALVLANTRANADSPEAQAQREINATIAEAKGSATIADMMIPALVASHAEPHVVATLRTIIEANRPAGIAAALRGMALRCDSFATLQALRLPTLLIAGTDDALTPLDTVRMMHEAVPSSRLVIIPGAGHLSNLERPDEFTAALRSFLS